MSRGIEGDGPGAAGSRERSEVSEVRAKGGNWSQPKMRSHGGGSCRTPKAASRVRKGSATLTRLAFPTRGQSQRQRCGDASGTPVRELAATDNNTSIYQHDSRVDT